MNDTGKKFISLFLVFSLLMLSVNLYAKERRGAKLIITQKDGQWINGELITVKPNSLLLLNNEGKDVSVDIADIKIIVIVKKSKALLGSGLGFLIGAGWGMMIAVLSPDTFDDFPLALWSLICAAPGALLGAMVGSTAGADKTIRIEGMTDSEIQETLKKLRKKARVRNYK